MDNNLKSIMKVLGEENVQRLKDSITDIILDNIRKDFKDYNFYLLDPNDIHKFINECKEEAFERIKEDIIKEMMKKIENCI